MVREEGPSGVTGWSGAGLRRAAPVRRGEGGGVWCARGVGVFLGEIGRARCRLRERRLAVCQTRRFDSGVERSGWSGRKGHQACQDGPGPGCAEPHLSGAGRAVVSVAPGVWASFWVRWTGRGAACGSVVSQPSALRVRRRSGGERAVREAGLPYGGEFRVARGCCLSPPGGRGVVAADSCIFQGPGRAAHRTSWC